MPVYNTSQRLVAEFLGTFALVFLAPEPSAPSASCKAPVADYWRPHWLLGWRLP